MVEALHKAKGGSTMYWVVENDGVKAENDKIICKLLYDTTHTDKCIKFQ